MLIIAQNRSLDLREVLKCELGPLPWSLSAVHGCFMKTDKSKLLHLLEQYSQPVDVVPADAAVIVDGMAMLQSLTSPAGTFGEVARQLFERLTKSMIAPGSRLDFVIDRCPDISIKYDEHHRCA